MQFRSSMGITELKLKLEKTYSNPVKAPMKNPKDYHRNTRDPAQIHHEFVNYPSGGIKVESK